MDTNLPCPQCNDVFRSVDDVAGHVLLVHKSGSAGSIMTENQQERDSTQRLPPSSTGRVGWWRPARPGRRQADA